MTARILVVDDEQAIVQVLQDLLDDEGYEVRTAGNGREALIRLADDPADLVLSDVMMPIMDGIEMCAALAADSRYRSIPVVLMSAAGKRTSSALCAYAAFVAKPFDVLELIATIKRVLATVKEQ